MHEQQSQALSKLLSKQSQRIERLTTQVLTLTKQVNDLSAQLVDH